MSKKTKILILGGGFGGLYTAIYLDRSLAKDDDIEITLTNKENFFLFTPMLHEVAASDLDITHIVSPIRKLLKRVQFFEGDIENIDLHRKVVEVSHGGSHHHHSIEYDHIVLSLGSVTNFYGNKNLADNTLQMKSLGDAIHLRNVLIARLEEADFECSADLRERLLTFVVAGGGFAGVETVAGINDFLRESLRYYPNLRDDMLRIVLVHGGEIILPELSEKLGIYAAKKLAERRVEIYLDTFVKDFSEGEAELSNGLLLKTETLVWTAGTAPNPIISSLPCKMEAGRICTDSFMRVEGVEGVWALGDCASVPDTVTGLPFPPTAQHAIRQGKVLARNLKSSIRGKTKMRAFEFKTIGQLAALGRRTGVAQILGYNFSGFVAWWLWRSIYLSKLPRFEKKLRVAIDWTLDVVFTKDLVQFLTLRTPGMSAHAEKSDELFSAALEAGE